MSMTPTRQRLTASRLIPTLAAALFALLLVGAPLSVSGQSAAEWDAAREQMTRGELEELLERLEVQGQSSAYSARLRDQARQSAELIRTRLRDGDFQVGDRIVLRVEQELEMSDTLIVRAGRIVEVPIVGDMALTGVLRSELQAHVEEHIGRYIRNPVVRTEALIRVSVHGEVGSPGFYTIAADRPVTDILMVAGGPTGSAKLTDLRIERGSARIWEGEALEMAVVQGRTLDQMNLQAGDRLVVPTEMRRDGWELVRIVGYTVGTIVSLGFVLARIF